jgi:hypothetical protein
MNARNEKNATLTLVLFSAAVLCTLAVTFFRYVVIEYFYFETPEAGAMPLKEE